MRADRQTDKYTTVFPVPLREGEEVGRVEITADTTRVNRVMCELFTLAAILNPSTRA